jgi:uncharacterized repeat protein (TIGR01451 family)
VKVRFVVSTIVALAVSAAALTATAVADPTADMSTTVSAPEGTTADTDVSFSISLLNAGPDAAEVAELTDEVPADTTFVSFEQTSGPSLLCTTPGMGGSGAISCATVSLASGASATFTLVVHVNPATPAGTFVTDTATVSTTTFDPNSENDSSTTSVLVGPVTTADMAATVSAPTGQLPDTDLEFSITIANGGPGAADATLTDEVPADTTFVSFEQTSGPPFSCTTPGVGGSGTISCSMASLPSGASATFTLVVHVDPATPAGTFVTDTATVSTSANDPNSENNEGVASTLVGSADLSTTMAGPSSAHAGEIVSYTVGVANAGPDPASAVVLALPLPVHMTFVSFSQASGPTFTVSEPAVGGTGSVTASTSSLGSGASAQFLLTLTIGGDTPPGTAMPISASVSADTADPQPANNVSTVTTTLPPAPTTTPESSPPPQPRTVICASVPSLLRLTYRAAVRRLKNRHCNLRLSHRGHAKRGKKARVKSQSVKPGKRLYEGDVLSVRLG